jgi:formylglycine-generating enzyme required for sulfatase activity
MRRTDVTGRSALVALLLAGAARAPAQSPAPNRAAGPAPYLELIPETKVQFEMIPVPAGSFQMGSPDDEAGRAADEGPRRLVQVRAFWMGAREVTWDEYNRFRAQRPVDPPAAPPTTPTGADAVSRPTPPYADETFGFGKGKQPVIAVTHHAAMEYCRWLSAATGHLYRLPTEAEWEYACRAGTSGRFPFAEAAIGDYAWTAANSDARPQPVGGKKANAWGLFDLNGNVAEWVIDHYDPAAYGRADRPSAGPVVLPTATRYPDVVRGGSWDDDVPRLRCAARAASEPAWSRRDPQQPQSIWWHTNASTIGFRVVRPVNDEDQTNLKGLRSPVTRQSP